eukprot:scaffold908_cov333-Prasinococcus_capsulatus_cf.AAC.7
MHLAWSKLVYKQTTRVSWSVHGITVSSAGSKPARGVRTYISSACGGGAAADCDGRRPQLAR